MAEWYLDKIRPYLKDIINDLQNSDTGKTQLTITINFFSFEDDNDEEHIVHSKSDNIKIMISDEVDEVIKNSSIHLQTDIKIIYSWWEVVSLSPVMFSHCIINVTK